MDPDDIKKNEDFTITSGGKTITISSEESRIASANYEYSFDTDNNYTISGGTVGGCIDVQPSITYNTSFTGASSLGDGDFGLEFDMGTGVQTWPTEDRILEMIAEYPALKLQYQRFLEVYNLCKDDFAGKDIDV
jgi:hypothetical protein